MTGFKAAEDIMHMIRLRIGVRVDSSLAQDEWDRGILSSWTCCVDSLMLSV